MAKDMNIHNVYEHTSTYIAFTKHGILSSTHALGTTIRCLDVFYFGP